MTFLVELLLICRSFKLKNNESIFEKKIIYIIFKRPSKNGSLIISLKRRINFPAQSRTHLSPTNQQKIFQ